MADADSSKVDAARAELVGLLLRIACADRAALRSLYDRTSAKLFGICLRICDDRGGAEEVMQEVYISVWHRASAFDPERASPITWLATIARNRSIDWRRARRQIDASLPIEEAAAVADGEAGAFERMEQAQTAGRLHICLDTLEQRARDAIRSAYFGGFSYAELASGQAVPLGTMKSWIRRGLERLRNCMSHDG